MFSPLPQSVVDQNWEVWEEKCMQKEDVDAALALPHRVEAGQVVVCPECNANLQTNDCPCPFCCSSLSDVSQQDSPRQRQEKLQRGQCTKVLQTKRRRAQMRLVNFKRGAIAKPRHGEPRCLEMFVSDLTAALARPRNTGGRFVSHDPTHASNAFDPVDNSSP